MDCNKYNQYYSDVVIDGKIVNERCFKGSEVYKDVKNFKINNYLNFDSDKYYNWINNSFKQSFRLIKNLSFQFLDTCLILKITYHISFSLSYHISYMIYYISIKS